jgi:hypothetical protein
VPPSLRGCALALAGIPALPAHHRVAPPHTLASPTPTLIVHSVHASRTSAGEPYDVLGRSECRRRRRGFGRAGSVPE